MSDRLTTFLVSLATDPDRLQRFAQNGTAELDAAGLSAEEKAAVLSRSTDAVRRAMGLGVADHMTQNAHTGAKAKTTKKKAAAKAKPKPKASKKK